MSYMRGDIYVWSDGERIHFWSRDGYDSWDDSVWNEPEGNPDSSGVALPQSAADEYVVMRFAQMLDEGSVQAAVSRALEKFEGNGGCLALSVHASRLSGIGRNPS